MVFDQQGLIYFTHQSAAKDPMDAIAVFDKDGKFIRSFGKEFHGGGHGLAIRKEGQEEFLYVCDIKNHKVAKLSLDGHIVWSLGTPHEAGVYEPAPPTCPRTSLLPPTAAFTSATVTDRAISINTTKTPSGSAPGRRRQRAGE